MESFEYMNNFKSKAENLRLLVKFRSSNIVFHKTSIAHLCLKTKQLSQKESMVEFCFQPLNPSIR